MNYIEELHKRVSFKEGKGSIEQALLLVYFCGSFSTRELARRLLLPVPIVTAIKKEGINLGIWEQCNGIQITEKGKRYIEDECGFSDIDKDIYLNLTQDEAKRELLIQSLSNMIIRIYT